MNDKQHFDSKYFDDIDTIPEGDNYFLPVLKELAQKVPLQQSEVLDVGCGTGLFLSPLVKWGVKGLYGVDGHNDYTDRAIARGYIEVKSIKDLCSDRLPYEDARFDLVISKDVFEHLLDPVHALLEVKRVLKPGGMFLFHVPNHFPLWARIKFMFTNNLDTFSFFPGESRWTFPHVRFYEHQDSMRLLQREGFSLHADMSHHFGIIPVLGRFPLFRSFCKNLVRKYPNQFAGGFTYLLRKN